MLRASGPSMKHWITFFPMPRLHQSRRLMKTDSLHLYRGMGGLSLPPEKAFSWTTDPCNALGFANHQGRGTYLVISDAAPDDIISYEAGFQYDAVIVRPGSVQNIRYADMFKADEQTFIPLAAPALPLYRFFGRQAERLGYQTETSPLIIHGLNHSLQVLLSLMYAYGSGEPLSPADRNILVYFSLLHDIGRAGDETDDSHGNASADLIESKGLQICGIHLSEKDSCMACLIIRYHCLYDAEGIRAVESQQNFTEKDKARAVQLYRICKDMDGLDRVRFNGLDYRMLRTDFARRLPLIAGFLLHKDVSAALRE